MVNSNRSEPDGDNVRLTNFILASLVVAVTAMTGLLYREVMGQVWRHDERLTEAAVVDSRQDVIIAEISKDVQSTKVAVKELDASLDKHFERISAQLIMLLGRPDEQRGKSK